MGKSLNDHHNDGQTDASNGDYNPPHSTGGEFAAFCGVSHKSLSEVHEENAAYRSGRENVKD
jgi:hypothetical protein